MENLTVIVETPKGHGVKYDYDPSDGYFKLSKIMPAGLVFPFDFGFIQGTSGEDGDPLDVMIISEMGTFPGCALNCRIVGAIKATQLERDGRSVRNDRFIAVSEVSVQYAQVQRLADLPDGLLDEIESFFSNYNQQAGKNFKPDDRLTAKEAISRIRKSLSQHQQRKKVELYIPVYDKKGNAFPDNYFSHLGDQLSSKFGGTTTYLRHNASGLWKENAKAKPVKEDMMIFEVMVSEIDKTFWKNLKLEIQQKFAHQEVMILTSTIGRI